MKKVTDAAASVDATGERNHFTFFNWCIPASRHPLVQQSMATLYPVAPRAEQVMPVPLASSDAGPDAASIHAMDTHAGKATPSARLSPCEQLRRAASHPGWTFMQVQ